MFTNPFAFLGEPPAAGGGGGGGYVNSVQHVTITIPTGSTSATATISSVGANAFIVVGGWQSNTGSNSFFSCPRLQLTNSTTVTAYRNTSSATFSVIVKCCVVDATSSLVASVQAGTITIPSSTTSANATISTVNNSYATPVYIGHTSTSTGMSYPSLEPRLTLSGTTLTATRLSSDTSSLTVGYMVVEFQSAACNQPVQAVQKSWTNSSSSTTETITTVDPDNTLVFFNGMTTNTSNNSAYGRQNVELTNGTTLTYSTHSAGSVSCYFNVVVVEFVSGVFSSAVKRGITNVNAASSNTSSIASVDTSKSLIHTLCNTADQTSTNITLTHSNVSLTNGTTVTVNRHGTVGVINHSWEVAEFA